MGYIDFCTIVVIIIWDSLQGIMVKIFLVFCFINSCAVQQQQPELYQHWVHSHEEDDPKTQTQVYRLSSYNFPPARGRESFQLKEDGVAIAHPIAPTDGNLSITRKWKTENGQLIIEDKQRRFTYKIISVSADKLLLHAVN